MAAKSSSTTSKKASKSRSTSESRPQSSLGQVKTKRKSGDSNRTKKKRRFYSEQELGIPKLNMITPVGVQKPKGKKKGKVFVDDPESMMTILAIVNAQKDGEIESKVMKARQMEEIREARLREAEKRQEEKLQKLEMKKNALRKKRKRKGPQAHKTNVTTAADEDKSTNQRKAKKRVSFG